MYIQVLKKIKDFPKLTIGTRTSVTNSFGAKLVKSGHAKEITKEVYNHDRRVKDCVVPKGYEADDVKAVDKTRTVTPKKKQTTTNNED